MKKNNPIQVNELTNEAKTSLKTRLISAAIAISIAVPCLILGDWFFVGIMAFCLSIAVIEAIRCSGQRHSPFLYIFAFFITFSLAFFPMVANIEDFNHWRVFSGFSSVVISITALMVALFLLFFTVVLDKNFTVRDACFIFTIIVLVAIAFQSVLFLRYFPVYLSHESLSSIPDYFNFYDNFESSSLAVYTILAACMTDTGAYFFGIFFGHKKINERISSKKTWAGFIGGILTSFAVSLAFCFILAACNHPVGGILTMDNWYHIVILSLALPFVSTLGDFVFSSIKRFYGIKDFGNLIPGHGGVLDRIDSIAFAGILAAVYIAIFFGPGNGGGFTLP